ncbi:MAG: cation:proton antiporter [Candidatus Latescibacteria bacterium]|nr:cation:proton antiporter [Candidatus Latescibacterota bacterium]
MSSEPDALNERFVFGKGASQPALVLCLLSGLGLGLFLPPIPTLERTLHPILIFLSGALGFFFGVKMELRILRKLSRVFLGLSLFQAFFTLLATALPLYFVLGIWGGADPGMDLLRISAVLGIVASVTMSPTISLLSMRTERKWEAFRVVATMALFGNVVAFLFLGLLLMLRRGEAISLPGVEIEGAAGRLLVALICGGLVGCLADFANSKERFLHERIYLVVGVLLIGAGAAAALGFPPVFVGMIAGMWLINGTTRRIDVLEVVDRIRGIAEGTFLVLMGAALPVASLLRSKDGLIALGMGVLLFALRFFGKTVGTGMGARMFTKLPTARRNGLGLTLLPQGGIALAVAYGQGLSEVMVGGILISVLLALFAAPYGWRHVFRETET